MSGQQIAVPILVGRVSKEQIRSGDHTRWQSKRSHFSHFMGGFVALVNMPPIENGVVISLIGSGVFMLSTIVIGPVLSVDPRKVHHWIVYLLGGCLCGYIFDGFLDRDDLWCFFIGMLWPYFVISSIRYVPRIVRALASEFDESDPANR